MKKILCFYSRDDANAPWEDELGIFKENS